ncbi:MAG: hypothetical protein M3O00_04720, partial [Pseudomonadota bacterium]|nr:hypothetical protein [Pseudomonadota bacterium]
MKQAHSFMRLQDHVMAAPVLWGSEISVNPKNTGSIQGSASVTAFADGSFLAVWTDRSADGDVVGRFFSADGTHKGEAFLVTRSSAGEQAEPQAALLSDGRYVVAWSGTGGTDEVGVRARVFTQDGQGGDDLYVGEIGFTGAPSLSVSALGDGFVVSYAYVDGFLGPLNAYAHVFDANGGVVGSRTKVNGRGDAGYGSNTVELSNGQFAVFFEKEKSADDQNLDIRCRVLSATGGEIKSEFLVPATIEGSQSYPSAARLNDGRIVVVWRHEDEATGDKSGSSIRGRIIHPDGWKLGEEFQVNLTTEGEQGDPQVTALADGGFAVTYCNTPDPINGTESDIRTAAFDATATARGEVILSSPSGEALEPAVTSLADGRLLVTWTEFSGESASDITAQIVDPRNSGVDLAGTAGNDHYIGTTFADSFSGSSGHDYLKGEGGNDILNGGTGADTLEGGTGDDVYHIGDGDIVREAPGSGNDLVIASIDFSLMSADHVERIEAAAGVAPIGLTGNGLDNTITGNAGSNHLNGGAGADSMTGGMGNDTYYVDAAGDMVVEHAGQGSDTVMVNTAFYALGAGAEVETVAAGAGVLSLAGSNFANAIIGNSLSNSLWGQAGNDRLTGDLGNDRLYGGSGNDRVAGGLGNDQLKGEAGRDVFVFDTRLSKSTNVDKVYDFKSRDDSFQLENSIFTKLGKGSSKGVKFKSDM